MVESHCQWPEVAGRSGFPEERIGWLGPGILNFNTDGEVNFHAYSMAGQGFEINYECEIEEPCEDEKPKKYCKKQKKKGKCNKAGIAKKCMKTCNKCE